MSFFKDMITGFIAGWKANSQPQHETHIMPDTESSEIKTNYRKVRPIEHKDIYTDHREIWDIASNVQIIRERKKITQKQLSESMGYKSTSFISRLELWQAEKITHEQVKNLAKCLEVEVNELLVGYERISG